MSSSSSFSSPVERDCCSCGVILPCTKAVDGFLSRMFYKLGHFVGRKPWLVMITSLLFAIVCASGFATLYTEDDQAKLWVPVGTPGQVSSQDYSQNFVSPRFNRFVVTSKAEGGNVLEKGALLAAYDILEALYDVQVTGNADPEEEDKEGDEMFDYARLDADPKPPGNTAAFSILYGYRTREELEQVSMEDFLADMNSNSRSLDSFGTEGREFNDAGDLVAATSMMFTFRLERGDPKGTDADKKIANAANNWEDQFLDVVLAGGEFQRTDDDLNEQATWATVVTTYPFASRTFADEFGAVVTGDLVLLIASYTIITAYVIANFASCDTVRNKVALSLLVILTNLLSVGAGFGLSSYFGLFFGPLHNVLPFVILGIGVDNAFVLVNSFGNTDYAHSLPVRSARSLRHSGVSITITSSTDMVAFAVGSITSLPALSSFCLYATVTILMIYILSVTFFQACIILDARRQQGNRYDCLCCFTSKKVRDLEQAHAKQSMVSKFLELHYGPAITSTAGLIFCLTFMTGLTAFGVYGYLQLAVESATIKFIPDDSYAKATLDYETANFNNLEDDVQIVLTDIDYFARPDAVESARVAFNKAEYADDLPFIGQPIGSTWVDSFKALLSRGNTTVDESGWPVSEAEFDEQIAKFALTSSDVVLDKDGKILRSKFRMVHLPIGKEVDGEFVDDTGLQVAAMDKVYEIVDSIFPESPEDVYAYSMIYTNEWETFKIIEKELTQNLSTALAAVFVITTLLIGHPATSFYVFICVLYTIVQLLGLSWAWGLAIDTVSVVNLVIAVGLAVDYAAHIGHCFMLKTGTRRERVIAALADIGAPVLNGAISTTLAICLLSASKSYVFRVLFQQFFGACVLGIMNGIITLPCLLCLIGPPSFHDILEPDDGDSECSVTQSLEMGKVNEATKSASEEAPDVSMAQLNAASDASSDKSGSTPDTSLNTMNPEYNS